MTYQKQKYISLNCFVMFLQIEFWGHFLSYLWKSLSSFKQN